MNLAPYRRTWLYRLITALALLAAPKPARATSPACVAIVGTNDLHGALEPYRQVAATDANHAVRIGGVIGLSGYIHALRQAFGERMVLVDGGDLFQGTLPSNMSLGRGVIDAYNALGYTAAAVGNHEFDFGALPGQADKLSVLKARIAEAKFPFLTLNIFAADTGERVAWPNTAPSILSDAGGVKVGIMGVSTVDTPKVTKPDNVRSLRFADPVPLIKEEARRLRARGAQLVVLVAHAGGKCNDTQDPEDTASCALKGADAELLEMIRALPRGTVDVAVGGHTHQFIAHWIGATATIESGSRGNFLGYVEACVRPGGGIDVHRSTIYPPTHLCLDVWHDGNCGRKKHPDLPIRPASFLGQEVEPQEAVEAAVRPYVDAVSELARQPLGVRLPKSLNRAAIAALTAEAMRRATASDFGMQNYGGVRTDIAAGEVRFAQAFAALPFDNMLVQVRMRGDQIEALLAMLGSRKGGRGLPALAGLKAHGSGKNLRAFTSKGQPLQADRSYTVCTSDFIVQGGEGVGDIFAAIADADKRFADVLMRDAFISLLQRLYPLPTTPPIR